MPQDRSNDRRDKALEDIARQLKGIVDLLAHIEKNTRPTTIKQTVSMRPDAFDVPQEPQPGKNVEKPTDVETRKDEPQGPVFPKSDNPYFKQRTANDDNPDRDFPLGA